ncbi:MAG TPA: ATP-dependent DNA ligase [Devosia sp.]|jgi:ATP-dependent DNA ligase|uniref:ATP-dependent DNA ligase n=1 Tax=Devosia sp. TaxID=1871048 RepID=UPI002DDDAD73|nr:ATP-dependent DNA ligase [Devosia sp.]HEV2513943.1 ATP-dependent DNA ligase [Devosia sp.]
MPAAAQDQIPLAPMEARSVAELPRDQGWQFEPKWDGFRCIAVKQGDAVALFAKSGKPLGRFFPDMVSLLETLPATDFVLDGELTIPIGGRLSFDALQMRLHPAASRVQKLAAEHPAVYVLFDLLLAPGGKPLASLPLSERRRELESFFGTIERPGLRLSPTTADRGKAEAWLAGAGGDLDGVIAKRHDAPYAAGERQMLKIKRIRTADCVVGGFRYGTGSKLAGSLLLGLYDDDGKLNHVGFTSALADEDKAELTRRLETLAGGSGFTGRAPGGPSRWSTERTEHYEALRPELVVEVAYDHVSSDRFRHGTRLLRWRPDKRPDQCRMEQLGK